MADDAHAQEDAENGCQHGSAIRVEKGDRQKNRRKVCQSSSTGKEGILPARSRMSRTRANARDPARSAEKTEKEKVCKRAAGPSAQGQHGRARCGCGGHSTRERAHLAHFCKTAALWLRALVMPWWCRSAMPWCSEMLSFGGGAARLRKVSPAACDVNAVGARRRARVAEASACACSAAGGRSKAGPVAFLLVSVAWAMGDRYCRRARPVGSSDGGAEDSRRRLQREVHETWDSGESSERHCIDHAPAGGVEAGARCPTTLLRALSLSFCVVRSMVCGGRGGYKHFAQSLHGASGKLILLPSVERK